MTDFSEGVIKRSYTIPVLVDFWAKWCRACKILSPTLEILKERHKSEWTLFKVEVDQHPEIAAMYNVTNIPTVKLFVDGNPVDGFVGAVPGHVIENWLSMALPSKIQRDLEKADHLISNGHEIEAEKLLSAILRENPKNKEAEVLFAKSIVLRRPAEAVSFIKFMEAIGPYGDDIDSVRTIAKMLTKYHSPDELPPSPAKSFFVKAVASLYSNDFDSAFRNLIGSLKVDPHYLGDFPKNACIALFNYLGENNQLTIQYRHQFGKVIF